MRLKSPFLLFSLFLTLALLTFTSALSASPRIVATIKPIHSLIAGLTQGLYYPGLLIDTPQSPHHYHLKPSDMRLLQQADLIIYAGPEIESFLQHTLEKIEGARIISVTGIKGIELLGARAVHHDDDNHKDHHIDGHTWLSITNARMLISTLLPKLQQLDPEHSAQYQHNANTLLSRLQKLEQDIKQRLTPVKDRPFIQFHDAFQYFEKSFGLSRGTFFTTGSEHKIGIQRLREVKQQIIDEQIQCIFYEPPTRPPILANLIVSERMQVLPMDPLGSDLAAGEDLYFNLMDNIARQLEACLATINDKSQT